MMGMNFANLDDKTRKFMLNELEQDLASNKLYLSLRLNDAGHKNYEKLLRSAIQNGDDVSLANSLVGLLKAYEQRAKPSGGYTTAKVPITAPETLAEGEFNRFYCRGVCRRAIEEGLEEVEVYRAKAVRDPRYYHDPEHSDGYTYRLRAEDRGNPVFNKRVSAWQNDLYDAIEGYDEEETKED